jgi:hypothetical protein
VAAADAPPGPDGVSTPVLVAGGSGGLLLVVGALLLTLLAMRRSLTRGRLVRGDPGERIAGAWREVTDALRLAGRPVGDDLAATEVAGHARQTLADARAGTTGDDTTADGPAVDELAALLNQVGFAPGAATPDQAAHAAEVATSYVATLRSARPWWRRLIWSVHPTPLRRARRSPR